ncbi:MAG: prepilin-type N-terminal cleavage/methylation domain-containing protein [Leuconostoc carnosum]|uniref:prepilin-type N-terminal cleavage/methylation domain-containing protein n=1 Tax=Leuconostoc carnosum TaxID=1252 RepID=UPI003F980B5F
MKHTNSAFTLLESLIVLTIVASMLLIGGQKISHQQSPDQWFHAFDGRWQQARLMAQKEQKVQVVKFEASGVSFDDKKIKYPKGYLNSNTKTLNILATGYVAPTTIILDNGQKVIKIVFSLGGGDYRTEIQ